MKEPAYGNRHDFLWEDTLQLVPLVCHWYTSRGMGPLASRSVFVSPTNKTGLQDDLDLKVKQRTGELMTN